MTKTKLSILATTAALALSAASPALAQSSCNWAGTWDTDLGELKMTQDGDRVSGTFTQAYKTRIMGPVSQSRGQCVGDLTVVGRNVDAGAMRGKRIVLSGNSFSGSVDDSLNDNMTMTRFTGKRQVKTYEIAPLATNQVKRGVIADNGMVNRRINERAVGAPLEQPMVKLKSTTKTKEPNRVLRNTASGTSGLPEFDPNKKTTHPYAQHLPWIADKPASFMPKYVELELTDFLTDRGESGNVYGLLGFYAGCMSDSSHTKLKPLRGQKNRVFSQSGTSVNLRGEASILSEPSRSRTRRFKLDLACFEKAGGEPYIQVQTNLKRDLHLAEDAELGYRGFIVNLANLDRQNDGMANVSNLTHDGATRCVPGHINTVTRAPEADTDRSMAFDWKVTAVTNNETNPFTAGHQFCEYSVESTVRIRFVE